MGYKLTREICDHAPDDLTSGELVVALMIADDANDHSRRSWIPLPLLCQRARLKPPGVRAALAKLAGRGYEFRVIHGYGKDGRPVYAVKGHATDYVVPDMLKGATTVAPIAPFEPVDNSPKGATTVAPNGSYPQPKGATTAAKGATTVAPLSAKGATTVAPLPSKNLNPLNSNSATAVNGSVVTPLAAEVIHRPRSSIEMAAWQAVQEGRTPR